uniref:Putative kinase binding protein n=1 Tax=Ornithodoros turicata TaxID=34597 RepID=A0A2R5LMQ2_9ACAR
MTAEVIENSNGKTTSVLLFTEVTNSSAIKNKVIAEDIPACVIRAEFILDLFQLQCAVKKALVNNINGAMKTRKVTTEVLYQLSPTKNIRESLRTFGARDDERTIVVVLINDEENRHQTLLRESINGVQVGLDRLSEFSNAAALQNMFKIGEKEMSVGGLLDGIITRMAVKDIA